MEYLLKNDYLAIRIAQKGAELQGIRRTDKDIDYLWDGHKPYWQRRAPVLFPNVGRLKDDTYFYEGQSYSMSQHGFARDMDFEPLHQSETTIILTLKDNEATRARYPFDFSLTIFYQLLKDRLSVTYSVQNQGQEPMYFTLGGHPAFKVPLVDHQSFNDYQVSFSNQDQVNRYFIQDNGLVDLNASRLETLQTINLDHQLFTSDAIVYELKNRTLVHLSDLDKVNGIEFDTGDFPYLGIWTQAEEKAPFLSLEPWLAPADGSQTSGNLVDKYGVLSLGSQETGQYTYHIRPF